MLQEIIDGFLQKLKWRWDIAKKYPELTDTYPSEAITEVLERANILAPFVKAPLYAVDAMMFIVDLWGLDVISRQIARELSSMDEFFLSDKGYQEDLFISCCTWERLEDPRFSLTTFQIFKNILKIRLFLIEDELGKLQDEWGDWVSSQ